MLTGSLLISHLKSHLPALHPFWLLFIDFPENALNLSCLAAQLCCSSPRHTRAVLSAAAMLPAFREPLHTTVFAPPFPTWTASDVIPQGCPHCSYLHKSPSLVFSMCAAWCAPWYQSVRQSLFWVTNDIASDAALFLVSRAPSAFRWLTPQGDNPAPPAAQGYPGWHPSPRLPSEQVDHHCGSWWGPCPVPSKELRGTAPY